MIYFDYHIKNEPSQRCFSSFQSVGYVKHINPPPHVLNLICYNIAYEKEFISTQLPSFRLNQQLMIDLLQRWRERFSFLVYNCCILLFITILSVVWLNHVTTHYCFMYFHNVIFLCLIESTLSPVSSFAVHYFELHRRN